MNTRRRFLALAAASAALVSPPYVRAQDYPAQQIRIIVGFAAGGNFDMVARILGQWLSERLRQPVLVENRPGAGSNIATEAVVNAAPNGYTLLLGGAVNAINETLYEKLPFNFTRDLAPVAGVVRFPNVLTVNPSFPAQNLVDFIAYVKAHPGKLSQGSSGNGTTQHLAGDLFKVMTGTDFAHIPYRGAAQAITDLLGGQVEVLFEPLPASLPFIKAGKLRVLAVTSATRAEILPEVPTIGEHVPGYEASGWTGVFAPLKTPRIAISTLSASINAGLTNTGIVERFLELGATTMPGSPEDFSRLVAAETDKWAQVVRRGNIKPT
jgi:tripartite-type tricarboxylate transporter receptor subunit TctC